MKRALFGLSLASGTSGLIILTLGFALHQQYIALVPILLLIAVVVIGERFKWAFYPTLWLTLGILMSSIGMILNPEDGLYFAVGVLTLSAWDLHRFRSNLGRTQKIYGEAVMFRSHLQRLGLVIVFSVVLGAFSLGFNFRMEFWYIVLLTMIAFGMLLLSIRLLKSRDFQDVR